MYQVYQVLAIGLLYSVTHGIVNFEVVSAFAAFVPDTDGTPRYTRLCLRICRSLKCRIFIYAARFTPTMAMVTATAYYVNDPAKFIPVIRATIMMNALLQSGGDLLFVVSLKRHAIRVLHDYFENAAILGQQQAPGNKTLELQLGRIIAQLEASIATNVGVIVVGICISVTYEYTLYNQWWRLPFLILLDIGLYLPILAGRLALTVSLWSDGVGANFIRFKPVSQLGQEVLAFTGTHCDSTSPTQPSELRPPSSGHSTSRTRHSELVALPSQRGVPLP
ncbi:hypothetical protein HDU85_004907 [Gaertneriomyces sp. JEL0708]|nr:hypothetical protein HDU85_004907 [Gaertneriomyces sp. JEL0708]